MHGLGVTYFKRAEVFVFNANTASHFFDAAR